MDVIVPVRRWRVFRINAESATTYRLRSFTTARSAETSSSISSRVRTSSPTATRQSTSKARSPPKAAAPSRDPGSPRIMRVEVRATSSRGQWISTPRSRSRRPASPARDARSSSSSRMRCGASARSRSSSGAQSWAARRRASRTSIRGSAANADSASVGCRHRSTASHTTPGRATPCTWTVASNSPAERSTACGSTGSIRNDSAIASGARASAHA